MMTEKVFFEDRNGVRIGPYKTRFGADRITVFEDELRVSEGDLVIQPLADGTEQAYIADVVSHNAARRNIPAHFSIAITKTDATARALPVMSGVDAPGSNNNSERIAAALGRLAECIENSCFPADQKDEAAGLLRAITAHPVIAEILKT